MLFYDISPKVIDIQRREFSFLLDSPAKIETVVSDGWLSHEAELKRGGPRGYDVLASTRSPATRCRCTGSRARRCRCTCSTWRPSWSRATRSCYSTRASSKRRSALPSASTC